MERVKLFSKRLPKIFGMELDYQGMEPKCYQCKEKFWYLQRPFLVFRFLSDITTALTFNINLHGALLKWFNANQELYKTADMLM
jgi:hypothetical protein